MTTLDALLERNRRANDLKRGLDRGIDHHELSELVSAYRKAHWLVLSVGWQLFIDSGGVRSALAELRDELKGGTL